MKTTLLILITFGLFGCEMPEYAEPMQVSKPVLVDSIAGYHNCQLIIMRTYYTYYNGQPSQAFHTRDVIGEPCFEANRQPINIME